MRRLVWEDLSVVLFSGVFFGDGSSDDCEFNVCNSFYVLFEWCNFYVCYDYN